MPGKKHVLLIDDNASFRDLVASHLERRGHRVSAAGDGPSGLALFAGGGVSAVLVDLRMPGMDGHMVLAELASRSETTPLIVISGATGRDDAIRAMRNGAWDFVVKDGDVLDELDHALCKAFERAGYLAAQGRRLAHETCERERAQEALANQLAFLQVIIDAVPDHIFYKDLAGRYLGCNQAFAAFMGRPREALLGLRVSDVSPAAEAAVYEEMDRRLLARPDEAQARDIDSVIDGKARHLIVRKAVFRGRSGSPAGIVGVFSDMTRQQEYAQKLRQNEERMRAMLDASPLPIVIVNLETGRTLFANRRASEQFGFPLEEAVGLRARRFYDDPASRDRLAERLLAQGRLSGVELLMRRTDGSRFWCQASAALMELDGARVVFISFSDITARKDLEAALEKYEFIANASHDLMTLSSRDHVYEAANRAYLEQLGRPREAVVGRSVAEVWGEESFREYIQPHFSSCLEGHTVSYQARFSFPGSGERDYEVFMYPYSGADGRVSHVATVSRDITERKLAEDRLREALEQVEAIQDNAIFGVGLFDDDTIVRINQRGADIFGRTPESLAGDHPSRYFPSERQYRSFRRRCIHGLVTAGAYQTEQQFRRADGALIWTQLSAQAMDRADLSQGVIWTILDITERRFNETVTRMLYQISNAVTTTSDLGELYEHIHAVLDEAIEAANFFIALLDRRRTRLEFTYFEDAHDDFRGAVFLIHEASATSLSVEVIRTGRPLLVTTRELPERDRPRSAGGAGAVCMVREAFLRERGADDASMLGTRSEAWLGVPLRVKGEVVGVMAVQSYSNPFQYSDRDVNLLVSVSEQVALAIERKGIEQDLRMARDLAEAANHSKNEFLANMSHELRTPLNGVLGMLQLAQTTRLTEEQRDYVDTALTSGRSLLSILNDILDFSKMEAGKLEVVAERFSLATLVQDVVSTFRGQVVERGLALYSRIYGDFPDTLVGAKSRLRQILFNVVGNGVKFTERGEVALEVSLLHLDPSVHRLRLLFSVRDTGIGIPDDAIRSIFEPFTQVDGSYMRRHQGTGLGLGIVKRLVSLMGGVLSIDTEEGRGTTVHMAFSLGYEPSSRAEESAARLAPPPPPRRLSLLLVEDNRVNRLMAERMLAKLGHAVRTAQNGEEAIEMLRRHAFDGVFMDIQMPGMDGLEATGLIRSAGPGSGIDPDIPVIAMTAHAMIGDREMFMKNGMTGYIAKPVDMKGLEDTLARLFFRRE
ncbi:PAS domain S-box protein [Pseudodesulfovibrio sp.]|uniref:PAS domain S-box protein n=1 Tax=Pseudodesulfovibrio sp. TaxID=2035812 RepID=UPI0026095BA0|nr:PAS domain S-box protein [Pseudodesulfovibrio sp.]MDD3310537.1 PAS domain S-box protein [Pseudodesulfovibrio sp.]